MNMSVLQLEGAPVLSKGPQNQQGMAEGLFKENTTMDTRTQEAQEWVKGPHSPIKPICLS